MSGGVKDKTFHKAVAYTIDAPKRKHVRKLIVDSWNYGHLQPFKQILREPLDKNACVCFKSFTVIHQLMQEGGPRVLRDAFNHIRMFHQLQQAWSTGGDVHYAKLCVEYAYLLRGKATFHHKHPLVIGNLSLDDYQNKVQNQPEVPIQIRQQMVGHLLDLQSMIERLQTSIFVFHGRDLHESKVAALVPLVVEADAVYRITVHHLTALCERIKDISGAKKYIDRFNEQYPQLRLFLDNCSRIQYVTAHVKVPQLPPNPPTFTVTGTLAHMVPDGDSNFAFSDLMNEGTQATPQQMPGAAQAQLDFNAQAQAQSATVSDVPQATAQQGSVTPGAAAGGEAPRSGWVSFGGPAPAAQQVTVKAAEPAAPAGQQLDMNKLRELLQAKDAEIQYWKSMYEQAIGQMQMLGEQVGEATRRADELENHLHSVTQQMQDERHQRLLRKLETAYSSVQRALGDLNDVSKTGNMSAHPEDVLGEGQSIESLLQQLDDAAMRRDHESLTRILKQITQASSALCRDSKGVADLTDNKELAALLTEATMKATQALSNLLEVIKNNPYDADAILAASKLFREANLEVVAATQRIRDAEIAHTDDDISDKATKELLQAAAVIEAAAAALEKAKAEARERAKQNQNKMQLEVSDAIYDAAAAITAASKNLVNHASTVQQENVASGRAGSGGVLYKKDITWSQGLISAAQSVASTVTELVKNADSTVKGEAGEEPLVAASSAVAGATTQLVVASRVRSDPNSQSQKELESAARHVSKATKVLVNAAQSGINIEEEEHEDDGAPMTMTEMKIREMDMQTTILRIEKELQLARQNLANFRKKSYQK